MNSATVFKILIRCVVSQVHGASRNAFEHLKNLAGTELNSVTDNPVVLSAEESISGGNFHGQLLALPLDYATLAAAEIGNIFLTVEVTFY